MVTKVNGDQWDVVCRSVPFARLTLSNWIRNILFVRKLKADVFHITGDIHYVALALAKKRTVLTIHDSVFMYRHKGIKKWFLKQLYLNIPVRLCGIVTTVSEQSKKDIIAFTGCDPEKVLVIPNPVEDGFRYIDRPFNQDCPRILFIGSVPHKNLERVIVALTNLSCFLDIIGDIDEQLRSKLASSGIKYEIRNGISEPELAQSYVDCDILLFPSLFEGFGLPIIEAQKSGRVVVTSNLSPMKEVAGCAGAQLVNPFDPASIREGIEAVINDRELRKTYIENGLINQEKYSVTTVAAEYTRLYEYLLNS